MKPEYMINELLSEHAEIKEKLLKLYRKPDVVLKWLYTPKSQLNGKPPVEMLETEPESVLNLLLQIQEGDFS